MAKDSKKLTRTVAVIFNEELLEKVNLIKEKAYDPDLSFSAVVRRLIEKGILDVEREIEEKEKIKKFYEESLKKE